MKFHYQSNANLSGIYKILNTLTNRVYIGQAARFERRWYDHKRHLLNGKHQNKFLLNDFNKCKEELGHDDFLEFHVLEVMQSSSKEERNKREEEWIKQHWDKQDLCYNFHKKTEAKDRSCYSNTPEETSKIISNNMKAVWRDETKNQKRLNTIHSEEYKTSQSQKMKKKWLEPSYSERQKILATEANRKTSSERMKKKWASDPEYREKMVKINKELGTKRQRFWDNLSEDQKTVIINKRRTATKKALAKHHGKIQAPDGSVYEVFNAREFSLRHGLSPSLLCEVFHGNRKQHKGWMLPPIALYPKSGTLPERGGGGV